MSGLIDGSAWQPFTTAPRDGSVFLARGRYLNGEVRARWNEASGRFEIDHPGWTLSLTAVAAAAEWKPLDATG